MKHLFRNEKNSGSLFSQLLELPNAREWVLWIALPLFAVGAGVVIWNNPGAALPDSERINPYFSMIMGSVLLGMLFYMLLLGILAMFCKSRPALSDDELPTCTVLVPAYNEGKHVAETLSSLLECDYPASKLQIIAINDGSQDDTWEWIQRSANAADGRILAVNLVRNGGKKHALYIGAQSAAHEIIVTVDSDSVLMKDALRNLVAPFTDPKIGAVAGNISAKNRNAGFISAMLDVTLVFGCEFLRAGQSATGCVFCTPGALSAYRRSAVAPLMDEWLEQTFMGAPAKIGEDRAIATLLLRSGWKIVHQSSAVALTCVPVTYKGLCKMLIRWTRSDIRENITMGGFVTANLLRGRGFALFGHWVALTIGMFLPFLVIPGFVWGVFAGSEYPMVFVLTNLLTALLCAAIPVVIYARTAGWLKAVWGFVFGWYYFFALSWIVVYSFFTMRNSKWLTRDLPVRRRSWNYRYYRLALRLFRF